MPVHLCPFGADSSYILGVAPGRTVRKRHNRTLCLFCFQVVFLGVG